MDCKGFCVSLTEQSLLYFNCSLILNFCLILLRVDQRLLMKKCHLLIFKNFYKEK